jgi:membrane-bound lytic murein transglycosylase MltF
MKRCLFAILLTLALWVPGKASGAQEIIEAIGQPWQGDFDEILERRQIRALVVYNKLMYFLDGATQRGASYDGLQQFEKFVNEKYNLDTRLFQVVYLPVSREKLMDYLVEGRGDIIAANLTVTPGRAEQVDFSDPIYPDVSEVLVTGPEAPEIGQLDDLAGREIHARPSSSYFESLEALNEDFEARGLDKVEIVPADEHLEDGDLLEMVNAGLLPMVFVDSHKAAFWQSIFSDIEVHSDIAIRTGGSIAWALRKDSPQLKAVVNEFIAQNKKGTLTGNIILKRYFKNNEWVRGATDEAEMKKLRTMVDLFRKYGDQYEFDYLMLGALGYQESQLDQSTRSPAGAIGVMQLKPSTAADKNVGIPEIEELESNIHAGTKYLRFIRDRYFDDPDVSPLDQTLLTFASYNAGPARIAKLRKETESMGLDPNVWFGNVEHAVAKGVGRETVQYVSHIFKYYTAYRLSIEGREARRESMNNTSE